MEVAEVGAESGVSKSSTSVSESSKQIIASGTMQQEISSEKSLEQSVEQSIQQSVAQESSQVIKKSVVSSVSEVVQNGGTTTTTTVTTKTVKNEVKPQQENGDEATTTTVTVEDCPEDDGDGSTVTTKVIVTKKIVTDAAKPTTEVKNDDDDVEEEVIEVVEGDESGEEVEITETVVLKKPTTTKKTVKTITTTTQPDGQKTTETKVTTVEGVAESEPVVVEEVKVTKPEVEKIEPKEDVVPAVKEEAKVEETVKVEKVVEKVEKEEVEEPEEVEVVEEEEEEEENEEEEEEEEEVAAPKEPQAQTQNTTPPSTDNTDTKQVTHPSIDINQITEVTESIKLSPKQVTPAAVAEAPAAVKDSTPEVAPVAAPAPAPVSEPAPAPVQASAPAPAPAPAPTSAPAPVQVAPQQPLQDVNQQQQQQQQQQQRIRQEQDLQQLQQQEQYKLQQQQLWAQQQRLLEEQQRLAQQIQQQQRLAQMQQKQQQQQQLPSVQQVPHYYQPQQQSPQPQYQPQPQFQPQQQQPPIVSKSSTTEESHSDTGYLRKNESYEVEENDGFRMVRSSKTTVQESHTPGYSVPKEHRSMSLPTWKENKEESSSTISKRIDLQKIFTPATDAEEILPKNRKLYASSAFYSPNLHPTVEDQVALARRISHSLSDISNHQSKGQSMYVNRKKRSVKWVHEGSGQPETQDYYEESKENEYDSRNRYDKVPLKLVMNPRGQVRDVNSVREPLSETGLLSPDKCAELVTALNAPKGRGAELFAKRRRKAEKWIVDGSNAGTLSPSGLPDHQLFKPTSPSLVPAYSDVGIHRVQLNMQQDQIQDKYSQPSVKIVKSPWEAALETGSASNAFEEVNKHSPYDLYGGQHPQYGTFEYQQAPQISVTPTPVQKPATPAPPPKPYSYNNQRDLAYKPSIPQGWKAPAVALPKESVSISSSSSSAFASFNASMQTIEEHLEVLTEIDQQVSHAAKTCEDLTRHDEDEIIRLMERTKLELPSPQQHLITTCLARSPELIVSEAKDSLFTYGSAVQELQTALKGGETRSDTSIQQRAQQCEPQGKPKPQPSPPDGGKRESGGGGGGGETKPPPVRVSPDNGKPGKDEEEEDYIKVPVKDLISTFEQQSAAEKMAAEGQNIIRPVAKKPKVFTEHEANQHKLEEYEDFVKQKTLTQSEATSSEKTQVDGDRQFKLVKEDNADEMPSQRDKERDQEELYVPREIPLESYAPPPIASNYSPKGNFPIYAQQPSYQTPEEVKPHIGFPLNKQATTPYYQSQSPVPLARTQPPKQQSWAPNAYQQQQTSSAQPTPVNFNPSPLPYEKLAKFENPDPSPIPTYQAPYHRPLAVPGLSSKVRNASPVPFSSGPKQTYPIASPINQAPSYGSNYTTPASSRPPSQQFSTQDYKPSYGGGYGNESSQTSSPRIPSVNLSKCQNFNVSARGWGGKKQPEPYHPIPVGPRITADLPYSDF